MEFEHWVAACFAAVILGLFGMIAYMNHDDNATMARMVANGANPITAQCAVKAIRTENREVCEAALH
ncbi:hypothetical protein F3I27_12515 [Pantoea sp. Bo_2]|uniref:hypothetical protein n=1 Tax=unclassified Pantoea TaxID=2630326 RepID=UPI001232239B|nr:MULTISPECIES: hypothetical protein [unclassified Pantoea]KAA5936459.1 hypothetical protein F3I57_22690 [Pantoea sp. VH_3]KAA5949677.1 hypothetical protein F3I56_17495 [Pantoea sp. VH_25]KAA5955404.1 hypothetical protein F3I55_12560 [Pantoea sp. VH_24]KAA5958975.1 hypothetical protein F3I53_13690 [Pantoea sp. VH_16]KAA5964173.1 hypothetical protein F3I54_13530 [Pantoea sp. VH_18]